jgi:hypothetical protein
MNTKKSFKKLIAVATGATMLGATLMGAMAADLSDYPDAFVSDGTFNGYIVVGEAAASVDNLASLDIATSMWYTAAGESETVTLEGDSWLATTSSNFLELGENITNIETYLDDTHLDALADGTISNAKGTAEYEQFLYFDESTATTAYQEDEEDNVGFFYKVTNADQFARYVLDFTTVLESDITSGTLDDIEDKTITMLGKSMTMVTAENTTNGVKLVLMGGATTDTLLEGESASYTIGGVDYEVELTYVDATYAQFVVNGESTNKLQDSETDVLADGTNLGVQEISYQAYAGGIHSATFFLGADKIEIEHGQTMKVNEETISEATVDITATETNSDISIDDITINMTADDDFFIGVGEKLSENPELEEPQVMFTENWDIELADVESTEGDAISVTFSESDSQADLTLTLYDGEVIMPLAYENITSADVLTMGESDNEVFVFAGAQTITDEDLFILNTADADTYSNDAKSYLLQYKGADDLGETNPKARIKNVATGETYERSITNGGDETFDLKLGGVTFNFVNLTSGASDDFSINMTDTLLTYGGVIPTTPAGDNNNIGFKQVLRTAANTEVWIQSVNATNGTVSIGLDNTVNVWANIDDQDLFDDSGDAPILALNASINGDVDGKELASSLGTLTDTSAMTDPSNSDVSYYVSNYGETVTATTSDSSPTKYELSVPTAQAEVKLYVTSGATTSTTTADGTLTQVQVVDASKLDSEIADATAQNLVVVGGPCVNTVAAELLGNPADCTEGFTAGVSRVKFFDNDGVYAMLVAGYSGDDTRLAGSFIAHRYDELSGEEVEIEGTTYSDATVAAPSEAVVEEVVEEVVEAEAEVETEE